MKTFDCVLPAMERICLTNNMDSLGKEPFKDINKINKRINKSVDDLQKEFDKIDKISSPIKHEKILGLIKTLNTEASLVNILECIKTLAEATKGAFNINAGNLRDILELIKMSIYIEDDLYRQLKDSDCSKESIANLLHDFCLQYDINNDVVEDLFEQLFNRTITLRNRINNLRDELLKHISAREKYIEDNNAQQFKQCKEENEKLKNQINVFKQDFSKLQKHLKLSFVISGIATIIAALSFAF